MAKKDVEEQATETVTEQPVVIPHSPDASGAGAAAVVAAAAGAPQASEDPADPPVTPVPLTPLGEALQGWLYGSLGGSALSRNTEAWNAVHAALPALEDIINAAAAEKKE